MIIQKIITKYRKSTTRIELTFEKLAHFAHYEDDAIRARARKNRQYVQPNSTWTRRGGQWSYSPHPKQCNEQRSVNLMNEDINFEPSDNKDECECEEENPQNANEEEDNNVFCVKNQSQRRRLPLKDSFDNGQTTLVGWVDPPLSKLICHSS